MEVVELHVLEFRAGCGEQFLADFDVAIHRAADIEEDEHAHLVAALGPHLDVEIALFGGAADGAGHVQLFGRALADPFAQAAQGDLDVAGAELDGVVEVLVLALVPDLDRLAVATLVLADADAFGMIAVGAEGRGAAGADHLVAALVALLLLLHALGERLHELVEAAHGLDLRLLLLGEEFLADLFQPLGGDVGRADAVHLFQALEDVTEHLVEPVDVLLILHEGCP